LLIGSKDGKIVSHSPQTHTKIEISHRPTQTNLIPPDDLVENPVALRARVIIFGV
jgi:hypothetical protein